MPPDHEKLLSALAVANFYALRAHSSREKVAILHNLMRNEMAKVDRSKVALRLLFAADRVLDVTAGGHPDAMKETVKACKIGLTKQFDNVTDKTWMEQLAGRVALMAQAKFLDLI